MESLVSFGKKFGDNDIKESNIDITNGHIYLNS